MMRSTIRKPALLLVAAALGYVLVVTAAITRAQNLCCAIEPLITGPQSLKGVSVPEPPNLGDFVMNRQAAIVLGKALFWEMNAGSDETQACASCHFSAGADPRIKNQLNPGLRNVAPPAGTTFEPTASGGLGGPNYTLRIGDFPFHQLADMSNRDSAILFTTDDVVSSQGVFETQFLYTVPGDEGTVNVDSLFSIGTPPNDINTRKVEPRNAPTVINAAFNFRNFWDGRASNVFNGASPFGLRDTNAKIWVTDATGAVSSIRVALANASAASQAVGPTLSNFEMSADGRAFRDVGHKLISIRALRKQAVDATDSVLGPHVYINPTTSVQGLGLKETYRQLIQAAFWPKYWNANQGTFYVAADSSFSQMEENFSLFWGLSIMLYEETLVSDDSRFDRYAGGQLDALTPVELQGLQLFTGEAHCDACHKGPEFTSAATALQFENLTGGLVERMFMGDPTALSQINDPQGPVALYDQGFYNLGVTPAANDIGVGGLDPFGNPLSFARQYVARTDRAQLPFGAPIGPDNFFINPCTFEALTCVPVTEGNPRVAVDGSFKVPTLRNVELTGPYFHNGGYATLESVVDFYFRGGNRRLSPKGGDTTSIDGTSTNLDQEIMPLGLDRSARDAIVAFLKSLTDDRVRWEMAPFDHPALKVPNGHPGNETAVTDSGDGTATQSFLQIPAVGAAGRAAKGLGPIQPFTPKP